MASTLKINTLTGVTTAGSINVTGEGNSTTTNLQQGLAKAWVNFNQTTPAVDDSFNISSVSDTSAGKSTNNFTNSMANTGYSQTSSAVDEGTSFMFTSIDSFNVSSCVTVTFRNSGVTTLIDGNTVCTSINGDLA